MPWRNSWRKTLSIALCATLGTPLFAVAEGTDELWEMNVKMEMAGMPMQMPAQTSKVCQPKNAPKEGQAVPDKDKDCKMTDVQRNGGKSTFKVVCSGKNQYTAT